MAGMHSAPPKLVRSFAFDDAIEVAGPVLVRSQQLNDDDLVENATTKSQDHLFAIAQRLKLSEAVTDVLVDRGNERVVHRVVRNKGAAFFSCGLRQADESGPIRQKADLGSRRTQRSPAPILHQAVGIRISDGAGAP